MEYVEKKTKETVVCNPNDMWFPPDRWSVLPSSGVEPPYGSDPFRCKECDEKPAEQTKSTHIQPKSEFKLVPKW